MGLLLEIYTRLLESANTGQITDAIKNRYRVVINYEGDPAHGIAPGIRTIEIYAYGLTKAGNPVIRAYQPYGDTASKIPNWKFFRLDRITSFKPTYSIITKPAPGFNPSGDKSMSQVYSIINFSSPINQSNMIGPKKEVGKITNMDKVLTDREKDKTNRLSQNKDISRFTNTPPKPDQGNINSNKNIPEPKIDTPSENNIENNNEINVDDNEEIKKIKDLNKRIDNARKIDLNQIPKK